MELVTVCITENLWFVNHESWLQRKIIHNYAYICMISEMFSSRHSWQAPIGSQLNSDREIWHWKSLLWILICIGISYANFKYHLLNIYIAVIFQFPIWIEKTFNFKGFHMKWKECIQIVQLFRNSYIHN